MPCSDTTRMESLLFCSRYCLSHWLFRFFLSRISTAHAAESFAYMREIWNPLPSLFVRTRVHCRDTEDFDLQPLELAIDTVRSSLDRKSTRLNSSHLGISYAVF